MSFILLGILNSQAAAAGVSSDVELISTTSLGSSASTIEITGLSSYASTYKHLMFRFSGPAGSDGYFLGIRPNNVTTNYSWGGYYGTGSSTGNFNSSSTTEIRGIINFSSTYRSECEIWLPMFGTNDLKKSLTVTGSSYSSGIMQAGGNWYSSTEISSLRLFAGGNIGAGSTLSVYGWK
jgi:hypothetical protein